MMTTTTRSGALARTGNGTLMARAPRSVSLTGALCLVELRGLEPLAPCLQRSFVWLPDLAYRR